MEETFYFKGAPIQMDDDPWLCPVCHFRFYPTNTVDQYCVCNPLLVRDILAAKLNDVRRFLNGDRSS